MTTLRSKRIIIDLLLHWIMVSKYTRTQHRVVKSVPRCPWLRSASTECIQPASEVKCFTSLENLITQLGLHIRFVRLIVQLKEFTRHLEYGQKQLLLAVVILIFDRLPKQLPKWCRPILTCRLTPSATNWMLTIVCKGILLRPSRDWRATVERRYTRLESLITHAYTIDIHAIKYNKMQCKGNNCTGAAIKL